MCRKICHVSTIAFKIPEIEIEIEIEIEEEKYFLTIYF